MPDLIEKRLTALSTLSREALRGTWKHFFGATPSSKLRRDLMIPILAYRIQEEAFGPLGPRIQDRLHELTQSFEKGTDANFPKPQIGPGTRLVREWSDRVHIVTVQTHGYEYQGGRYRSLSQIARLITGTRWSGPLFFRISGKQSSKQVKVAQ